MYGLVLARRSAPGVPRSVIPTGGWPSSAICAATAPTGRSAWSCAPLAGRALTYEPDAYVTGGANG